jgi:hypothetical protein
MIKQKSSKNKASFLILPMLADAKEFFDWQDLLINCYVQDLNYPKFNNHIIVAFDYSNVENNVAKIQELEYRIYNNLAEELVYKYNLNETTTVFIFNVPKKHQEDYDMFIFSKYSKMSTEYKNKILKFHDTNISGLTGVLNRSHLMLQNIHRNLGCLNSQCKCTFANYLQCSKYSYFEFNFKKAEVWGVIDEKEVLQKPK